MRKQIWMAHAILFLLVLILYSCAAQPKCEMAGISDNDPGLWLGLYHGFILPFSLLGKIFNLNIGIHASSYSGSLYWIGYLIGITLLLRIIIFFTVNNERFK